MTEELRMPIGKFKNKLISEIKDIEYLKCLLLSLKFTHALRKAIIEQIEKREKRKL